MNTLDEYLNYIESIHIKEIDLSLERIKDVYMRLYPRGVSFKVISIAGTNGKGSTGAFLCSGLKELNISHGWFSSPHILRFNERFYINGTYSSDEDIIKAFDYIENVRGNTTLSYFEFATLTAIVLFDRANVDVAVMEVGLGGRLDSTNILNNDIAIITSIGLDHTEYLGNSLSQIAYEKSGIMRVNYPVIVPETIYSRVIELADNYNAILHMEKPLQLSLIIEGKWQCYNAALANKAVKLVCTLLGFAYHKQRVLQSFQYTSLPARSQKLEHNGKIFLIDVAHNAHAVEQLVTLLPQKCVAIFAVFADKDYQKIISLMQPYIQHWYIFDLDSSRALSSASLYNVISTIYENTSTQQADVVTRCSSAQDAVNKALIHTSDMVVVFGSFITISAILPIIDYN